MSSLIFLCSLIAVYFSKSFEFSSFQKDFELKCNCFKIPKSARLSKDGSIYLEMPLKIG